MRLSIAHSLLLPALLLACTSSPEPTDPPKQTPISTAPVVQPPSPAEAITQSVEHIAQAHQRAAEAAENAPAHLAAQNTRQSALAVVDRVQKAQIPAARWQASQIVALALYSADLHGVYPLPKPPKASKKRPKRPRQTMLEPGVLTFYYQKSGKRIDLEVYDADGRMRPEALATFSKALYAPGTYPRHGEDPWIAHHPRLLAMLYFTAHHYGKPIEIISAFRVPKRGRGSNHSKGRAVDIRVIQVKRRRLLSYLDRSFTAVGIGWYPNSTFIHLDTRRRSYHWTDRSRPGQRQRNRKRKVAKLPRPGTDPTRDTVHIRPLPERPH